MSSMNATPYSTHSMSLLQLSQRAGDPRKDKYNKNICKYHVEVDEDDEDVDEDLEREIKTSRKAGQGTCVHCVLWHAVS